jgi:hypothetical protein
MPDPRAYQAGETLDAKMTLKAGPPLPYSVSLTLSLSSTPAQEIEPGRPSFIILTWPPPPAHSEAPEVTGEHTIIVLKGTVPPSIVGGTYKATSCQIDMPDRRQYVLNKAKIDPDGDFEREIADDSPAEIPRILDLD